MRFVFRLVRYNDDYVTVRVYTGPNDDDMYCGTFQVTDAELPTLVSGLKKADEFVVSDKIARAGIER